MGQLVGKKVEALLIPVEQSQGESLGPTLAHTGELLEADGQVVEGFRVAHSESIASFSQSAIEQPIVPG